MAVVEPEIVIYRLPVEMKTRFQWLNQVTSIFGFAPAIFNFRLPFTSENIRNGATDFLSRDNWLEPLKSRFYIIWEPKYKYFRFGGRHLEFPTSGYLGLYQQWRL